MSKKSESFKIAGLGEVLWDIYRDRRHIGGAPANLAVHLTQLGDQGIVLSRVGDDGIGQELIRALKQRKLNADYVQIDKRKGTGTVLVSLDVKGVPSFHCSKDVAFDYLEYSKAFSALAPTLDAVVFGTLAQRTPVARRTILQFLQAATKAVIVFDVNSRASEAELHEILPASLELAHILKMSAEEAGLLRRVLRRDGDTLLNFARHLIGTFDLKLVAVTLGTEGCEIFSKNDSCRIPALPVTVVDTTGAGDAFTSGLIHKALRKAPLRETGEFANLIGAYLCTQSGATPVFDLKTLETFRESLET